MLEWHEDLSVGVNKIDDEHKELITLINDFYLSVDQKQQSDQLKALKQVASYALQHFTNEEALLKSHQYPGLKKHELIHKQLLQRLNELSHGLSINEHDIGNKIKYFLKNWLTAHIKGIDKQYSVYVT